MSAANQRAYVARQKARDPGWIARQTAQKAAWRRRNREKHRAHSAVYKALRAGRITRPEQCSQCEKPCRPEAHHRDYARPLMVVWLCRRCHARAQ